jgi:hypothetical protein
MIMFCFVQRRQNHKSGQARKKVRNTYEEGTSEGTLKKNSNLRTGCIFQFFWLSAKLLPFDQM